MGTSSRVQEIQCVILFDYSCPIASRSFLCPWMSSSMWLRSSAAAGEALSVKLFDFAIFRLSFRKYIKYINISILQILIISGL